jgi:hypothetical protein
MMFDILVSSKKQLLYQLCGIGQVVPTLSFALKMPVNPEGGTA